MHLSKVLHVQSSRRWGVIWSTIARKVCYHLSPTIPGACCSQDDEDPSPPPSQHKNTNQMGIFAWKMSYLLMKDVRFLTQTLQEPWTQSAGLDQFWKYQTPFITSHISGRDHRIGAICLSVCLSVCTLPAEPSALWPWFLVWELTLTLVRLGM